MNNAIDVTKTIEIKKAWLPQIKIFSRFASYDDLCITVNKFVILMYLKHGNTPIINNNDKFITVTWNEYLPLNPKEEKEANI